MSVISIVEARETIFFSYVEGRLRQWVRLTIQNRSGQVVSGTATVAAGGEEAVTVLEIRPGVRDYTVYAPTLWPLHPPEPAAPLCLTAGGETATATVPVGAHRPWTIYLLSDVCTDYTWAYASVDDVHADDAAITEAELLQAEATRDAPEADRNHYNFVHAREVEFYLERYPDQAGRLFDHIREGTITLNPIYNMCLTGDMSLEELIRQFYPARRWAKEHGLEVAYANHQETPTIAWAMVPVLAGSGVRHLVKSILPYECPWAARLEEPPVFVWEGPDGSRILVRRHNKNYVEGNFVLRDLRATCTALHTEIIPRYEALGEQYPFDAIALVGCYGDLSPHSKDLPARKVAGIAAYNAQGWDYPRLVNASHAQFWRDIEAQIAARQIAPPTYRGDYGASWEAWPSSVAREFAGWRRAQERAAVADGLAALLSCLASERWAALSPRLAEGWMNLIYLADHAWNGADDENRALNARLRREWQTAANEAFDAVIGGGLAALAGLIPADGGERIVVFNGLCWPRTDIVRWPVEQGQAFALLDAATGEPAPVQFVEEDGQTVLYFEARAVPALGYRVFTLAPRRLTAPAPPAGHRLESPFYALEISPLTGGIVSLYDKVRGVELVDPASPYHLNQCLYLSDGVEHTPQVAAVEAGPCGPVFSQLIVRAELKNTTLTTRYTVYAGLDRLDIHNELEKLPTDEKQELDFAFPFRVPGCRYRFEAPGAIITAGADQRPGAGQAVSAVRHFVDVCNDRYGVTLVQADSGLVEFGRRTSNEDPPAPVADNGTVLALALQNHIDWHEAIRDQAGATHFVFRYSLRGHAEGFDAAAAVRFGWENANNELLAVPLRAGVPLPHLPPDAHSFLSVTPENIVVTCLKVAEEEGLIVRLWECAGRDTLAALHSAGLGTLRAAWLTDLLERDVHKLDITADGVAVPLRAYSLATVRLQFET